MTRIWKRTGDTWCGYGNGHKAFIYEMVYTDNVAVHVHAGDKRIAIHEAHDLAAGKRWAERHYLKENEK